MSESMDPLEVQIANANRAKNALEQKLDDAIAERDAWKKKYEDLEINRASCCVEMEDELEECKKQIENLRHLGQDMMHRLNEPVDSEDINAIAQSQTDEWAKESILKVYRKLGEAEEAWKHFQKCFVEEMKVSSELRLDLEKLKNK